MGYMSELFIQTYREQEDSQKRHQQDLEHQEYEYLKNQNNDNRNNK